jgi:hypothetical protein
MFIPIQFFLVLKPFIHLKDCRVPILTFLKHICICSMCFCQVETSEIVKFVDPNSYSLSQISRSWHWKLTIPRGHPKSTIVASTVYGPVQHVLTNQNWFPVNHGPVSVQGKGIRRQLLRLKAVHQVPLHQPANERYCVIVKANQPHTTLDYVQNRHYSNHRL